MLHHNIIMAIRQERSACHSLEAIALKHRLSLEEVKEALLPRHRRLHGLHECTIAMIRKDRKDGYSTRGIARLRGIPLESVKYALAVKPLKGSTQLGPKNPRLSLRSEFKVRVLLIDHWTPQRVSKRLNLSFKTISRILNEKCDLSRFTKEAGFSNEEIRMLYCGRIYGETKTF